MTLTADMVACAVVAAARELDEHPEDIEVPPTAGHTDFKSRYYAARMLVRRFPDVPRLLVLRSLGYRTTSAASAGTKLAPSLQPRWFSGAIFDRCWVRFCDLFDRHVRVTDEPPTAAPAPMSIPGIPGDLGDYAAGKSKLRRMIADAMANTPGARPA